MVTYKRLNGNGARVLLLGEKEFINPFVSNAQSWVSDAPSRHHEARETVVELLDAPTSSVAYETVFFETSRHGTSPDITTLRLRFSNNDTNWLVISVKESDATGNNSTPTNLKVTWNNGICVVTFPECLWPVEPIRYHLTLRREYGFPLDEELTIKNVPVPEAGGATEIGMMATIFQKDFKVEGLVNEWGTPSWE